MAIFQGDFHDGLGVPFDPNYYGRREKGTSKVIHRRNTYHRLRDWQWRHKFILRKLALLWTNELTIQQKVGWYEVSGIIGYARDYAYTLGYKPFTAYALCNYPHMYYGGGTYNPLSATEAPWILGTPGVVIDSVGGMCVFQVTYQELPPFEKPACTWVYQIEPRRAGCRRPGRFTRMMRAFDDWEEGVYDYFIWAMNRWEVKKGEVGWFLLRHMYGNTWQESIICGAEAT